MVWSRAHSKKMEAPALVLWSSGPIGLEAVHFHPLEENDRDFTDHTKGFADIFKLTFVEFRNVLQ